MKVGSRTLAVCDAMRDSTEMKSGRQKGEALAERLLDFGAEILEVVASLPDNLTGKTIARQLVRCGPAGGAHYEEARGAESRADFVHKLGVALKEIRETVHWLKLIDRARLIPSRDVRPLIREGGELIAIVAAAARTARSRLSAVEPPPRTA
jgi:four helix bundle protein